MTQPLNIIFAGTPNFSLPALKKLVESLHNVVAVYTQPDRPRGRGRKLLPSAIKQYALTLDIPIIQPETFRDDKCINELKAFQPDLMVVVAYGMLLPQQVLDIPKYGCLNIHASLLPRWRGAAPIQRALLAGDSETGISIMQMEAALDAGPILAQTVVPITDKTTGSTLYDDLSRCGAELLINTLPAYQENSNMGKEQDSQFVTYAKKITKEDLHVNWQQSSQQILRQIKTFNEKPVCFSFLADQNLKIWYAKITDNRQFSDLAPGQIAKVTEQAISVCTKDGSIDLLALQLPGYKMMPVSDLLRGHSRSFAVGMQLS